MHQTSWYDLLDEKVYMCFYFLYNLDTKICKVLLKWAKYMNAQMLCSNNWQFT